MGFFERDAVVVRQLRAGWNRLDRFDEDTVAAGVALGIFDDDRFAVRRTAGIDPARDVAADIGLDHVVLVEREQERVARVVFAAVAVIDFLMRPQRAAILDKGGSGRKIAGAEKTLAMNGRAAQNNVERKSTRMNSSQ